MSVNMAKRRDQLIKVGICARTADIFQPWLRLARSCHASLNPFVRLRDEGCKEVMQRILSHRLGFLLALLARLCPVVLARPLYSSTMHSLWSSKSCRLETAGWWMRRQPTPRMQR